MPSAPGPKHLYSTRDEDLWLRLNEASLQTCNPYHIYFMFMEIKKQQKGILD